MSKKESNRKYYQQNKEYHNKKSLEYYYRNKEKILKMNKDNHKKRYLNDSDYKRKLLEYSKKNYWDNRERHLEYAREYIKKTREETLRFVGGEYGVKCRRCDYEDVRALQIDHVNGGGRKEIRALKNNRRYLKLIKSKPENYQILCANCNWIKKVENNEVK